MPAADLAEIEILDPGGMIQIKREDAGLFDGVDGRHVHREPLGCQPGLDQRIDRNSRLHLFDISVSSKGTVA